MKVTKFTHACLLVEIDSVRILTDVGSYNPQTPDVTNLAALLITHEHQDHFEVEKIQEVLAGNPDAVVITHPAVGEKLEAAGIAYASIEPAESIDVQGVRIESYGTDHAIIYGDTPPCRNTGYLIGEKLFIPGDAVHDVPPKPVEVLALPTGGPWLKVREAIDYAKEVKPKVAFNIHDAMYTEAYKQTSIPRWIGGQLEAAGIRFVNMSDNSTEEF